MVETRDGRARSVLPDATSKQLCQALATAPARMSLLLDRLGKGERTVLMELLWKVATAARERSL